MPVSLNRDVSTFSVCFTKACRQGDNLLFRSGNVEAVDDACKRATVGKLLPNALYVHRDALDSLEPLLRVLEGCGRAYLGEVEGANLIKLHGHSGKVSYLVYPDFETDPHGLAAQHQALAPDAGARLLRLRQEHQSPVLHRKETFPPPGHALAAKFAWLTRQEDSHDLLDETATISTCEG